MTTITARNDLDMLQKGRMDGTLWCYTEVKVVFGLIQRVISNHPLNLLSFERQV